MNHFGYFGKVPLRGDFVRFNLPQSFVKVWDDWLQQIIPVGEQLHGDKWPDLYHKGNQYRFALSTGIAGAQAWAGILVPSSDKVGRRFPFCLAAALPAAVPPVLAMEKLNSFFLELEQIAKDLNSENFEFDSVQDTLKEMSSRKWPLPNLENSSSAISVAEQVNDSVELLADSASTLLHRDGAASILDVVLSQTLFHYSIWCTGGNSSAPGHTLLTRGLPTEATAISLLTRDWKDSSCTNIATEGLHLQPVVSLPSETAIKHKDDEVALEPDDKSPQENESLSTGDWSELLSQANDEASVSNQPAVVTPAVETLEFEDDSSTAPWES